MHTSTCIFHISIFPLVCFHFRYNFFCRCAIMKTLHRQNKSSPICITSHIPLHLKKGGDILQTAFPHVIAVTGHYGSGKTNFSVNLAISVSKDGVPVTIVDLDIVNPYFRTADFSVLLREHGIRVITPEYANTNLDIPILPASVDAAISQNDGLVILDVGGDDAGAIALGRYAQRIKNAGYDLLYVVNESRYLTKTPEEAAAMLAEIEQAARLKATGLVNNTNLGAATDLAIIRNSADFAGKVSALTNLPVRFTCVPESCAAQALLPDDFPVHRFVKAPWEE